MMLPTTSISLHHSLYNYFLLITTVSCLMYESKSNNKFLSLKLNVFVECLLCDNVMTCLHEQWTVEGTLMEIRVQIVYLSLKFFLKCHFFQLTMIVRYLDSV